MIKRVSGGLGPQVETNKCDGTVISESGGEAAGSKPFLPRLRTQHLSYYDEKKSHSTPDPEHVE